VANANWADSYDFVDNDSDPTPDYSATDEDEPHGTCCAGIAAESGGNGIGGTGAAPMASIAGLRISLTASDVAAECAAATTYHSSGADTAIAIESHSYSRASTSYVATPSEVSALVQSMAAGTIQCFAAGNARGASPVQDSNKLDLQNTPGVINVAALASSGVYSNYSSFGANITCCALSSSTRPGEIQGTTTTDMLGAAGYNPAVAPYAADPLSDEDYTTEFGGTSSATPLVAGILALAKQANPALDPRMAKHLLAITSQVVDPNDTSITSDGGWKTNAAGIHTNQNYGFGLIDAEALVKAATQYSGVTPLQTFDGGKVNVNQAVPDNDTAGVTSTFDVTAATPLEDVMVTLDATGQRGQLEGYLTSPSGTTSRIFISDAMDTRSGISDWTYDMNAFWGEDPNGLWTIRLDDISAGHAASTFQDWDLSMNMGELIPVPEPASPGLVASVAALAMRRQRKISA
jgi:subtilisin-like proprotein convertase family protein